MQDRDIWWNTIPLDSLLNELRVDAPNASHIVVFDACRNELRLPEKTAVKGFDTYRREERFIYCIFDEPEYCGFRPGHRRRPLRTSLGVGVETAGTRSNAFISKCKADEFSQRPATYKGRGKVTDCSPFVSSGRTARTCRTNYRPSRIWQKGYGNSIKNSKT